MITIINAFRDWISETKITYKEVFLITQIIYAVIFLIVRCQIFVISVIDTIFCTQIFNILKDIINSSLLVLAFVLMFVVIGCFLHDTITGFKKK